MSVFKIATTFKRRGSVFVPAQSDSGVDVKTEIKFVAEFKQLKREEDDALRAKLREGEIKVDEFIGTICVGVYELKREDGSDIPPLEARDLMMGYDITASALVAEYNAAQVGGKAKNSAR